ncbi:MAG: hypothetical protein JOZ18_10180 [Chloroflexi bacterium]|nr:hypothetical protein [Chloroflexota bacterium]
MLNFDSPRIRLSLGQAALREPYPSWILDPYGVFRSANLLAFWLWDQLGHGGAIQPDLLIGRNIFDIQAANFERLPLTRNIEFYAKRSALVKRVAANWASSSYSSFIAKMKADPRRARIYEDAVSNPEHIWEYRLIITAPESDELLELRVTNYCLEGEAGFLALTSPTTATLPVIEKQYSRLVTRYGEEAYIISDRQEELPKSNSFLSSLPDYYRAYYPTMVRDPLWYIVEENKAQQLLFGGSAIGKHFFELYFAHQLRPWLGPLQETSAPRAMRYFETLTSPFQREDHELHTAYTQALQRLSQFPDYRKLMELSWKSTIHLNLPENKETAFCAYRVFLPWTLAPEVTLQFRSIVHFLYKGLLISTDQPYYQEMLIPENYETEVALLLSYLSPDPEEHISTLSKQMLWGLALLKTLQEGLANLEGGDAYWDPETAFRRIHHNVESKLHTQGADMGDAITIELRKSLEALKGIMDAEVLLSLLKIMAARKSLEHFGAFLAQEVEHAQ